MGLKVIHDSVDDIPEAHRELYTEQEGKFVLTGVEGIKTQGDIDRVHGGLVKERDEHKATKLSLAEWGDLKPDEVRTKLDRFAELEIAAKGNKDEMDAKLEELTEARVGSRLAPVERENKQLKDKLAEATTLANQLMGEKTQRTIGDKVVAACLKEKVLPEAQPDVILLANQVFEVTETGEVITKENPFGVTPGMSPEAFLMDMQPKRTHWWPRSQGGGAGGSGGGAGGAKNPWSADHWNMTEQGKVVQELGIEKAEQMAKLAGTTIGGSKPQPKK